MHPITIIGSGLAGYSLAREIRKLNDQIDIRIITADAGQFYSKPMLSNALSKKLSIEKLTTSKAQQMAEQHNLQIVNHCRVQQIDAQQKQLITDSGVYPYSQLILANGANPIHIPISGNAADRIISINSLDDYAHFTEHLKSAKHVSIMGAGLIGCEFANDLSNTGYQVTLIDLADRPLGRLLPDQAAADLQQKLSHLGVEWYLSHSVQAVNHKDSELEITLNDGARFSTDLVLSAIGLRADTHLAESAGLEVNRGIVVNEYLQTSNDSIYALGDCMELNGSVLPFVMPIMIGARALARTLTGDPTPVHYPAMPVVVKTPTQPVVVCPPPMGAEGQWQETLTGSGVKACFYQATKLMGFALTGDAVAEKQQLVKQTSLL
ncbi:MAG: FAD-dependent oxidoreductase [Gammaproteobacteria bacterium]|nr:FAD-dependent oxidoreductase [Gammaproteobacteria bacterium]